MNEFDMQKETTERDAGSEAEVVGAGMAAETGAEAKVEADVGAEAKAETEVSGETAVEAEAKDVEGSGAYEVKTESYVQPATDSYEKKEDTNTAAQSAAYNAESQRAAYESPEAGRQEAPGSTQYRMPENPGAGNYDASRQNAASGYGQEYHYDREQLNRQTQQPQPPQYQYGAWQNQQPYGHPAQQYQQSRGYYRPQTNEYVYAPQPPKKKRNVGKGLLIAVVTVLSVFVVSLASVSLYRFVTSPGLPNDTLHSKVPMDEHEFRNDADEEDVDDKNPMGDSGIEETEDVAENANGAGNAVAPSRTQLRDFPSIEQLAAPDDAMSIPDIYDKVSPSVVGVSCKVSRGTQLGTGFIISEDGYILTNAHVIDGGQTVMVVDSDMNEYEAEVIGSDAQTDIAVLKIDPSEMDIVPVEFGKSSELRIGELAIAIGNPLGFDLYGTMTTGIISGLNRTVTIEDNTMTLLQTSASINNGNSGGPLINAYGQVIGITSAKIDSTYGESLGFAIPIDEALPIVENLVQYGYVIGRPSIGISGKDITEILSIYLGVPEGVYVSSVVDGSGAQAAGIQPEDIIIGIEGTTITNMNELNEVKNKFKVGDTVTLTIYRTSVSDWGGRNGESFDVEVVLGEASPDPQG